MHRRRNPAESALQRQKAFDKRRERLERPVEMDDECIGEKTQLPNQMSYYKGVARRVLEAAAGLYRVFLVTQDAFLSDFKAKKLARLCFQEGIQLNEHHAGGEGTSLVVHLA